MAKQVVDTDRIMYAASRLRTADSNINNEFRNLQSKAKQLETNWKGAAATAAQTTMYQLFRDNEVRSSVLQNYINMLEQQVNPGYSGTETANKKLADSFK